MRTAIKPNFLFHGYLLSHVTVAYSDKLLVSDKLVVFNFYFHFLTTSNEGENIELVSGLMQEKLVGFPVPTKATVRVIVSD